MHEYNKKPIKWDKVLDLSVRLATPVLVIFLAFQVLTLNKRVAFLEGALNQQVEINEQVVDILKDLVNGSRT